MFDIKHSFADYHNYYGNISYHENADDCGDHAQFGYLPYPIIYGDVDAAEAEDSIGYAWSTPPISVYPFPEASFGQAEQVPANHNPDNGLVLDGDVIQETHSENGAISTYSNDNTVSILDNAQDTAWRHGATSEHEHTHTGDVSENEMYDMFLSKENQAEEAGVEALLSSLNENGAESTQQTSAWETPHDVSDFDRDLAGTEPPVLHDLSPDAIILEA